MGFTHSLQPPELSFKWNCLLTLHPLISCRSLRTSSHHTKPIQSPPLSSAYNHNHNTTPTYTFLNHFQTPPLSLSLPLTHFLLPTVPSNPRQRPDLRLRTNPRRLHRRPGHWHHRRTHPSLLQQHQGDPDRRWLRRVQDRQGQRVFDRYGQFRRDECYL